MSRYFVVQRWATGDTMVPMDTVIEWLREHGADVRDHEGKPWETKRERSRREFLELMASIGLR